MGFYVRKSLKAGPFRFNLSSSGIGVSAGFPGFRVGTGPRGNYVHMGANGLYYRSSGGGRSRPSGGAGSPLTLGNAVPLEDITGATVEELVPTGGGDLVEQLNVAGARFRWGWLATLIVALCGILTLPFGLVIWAAGAPVIWWLFLRDAARSSVVVFYDVNDIDAKEYEAMVVASQTLSLAQGLWRVVLSGRVQPGYQHKVNAGAGTLVSRVASKITQVGPKVLVTNVAVPSIEAGNTSMYFLPDRVLVRDGKRFTDIAYEDFTVRAKDTQFIESPTGYPRDAQKVGETWQYVNLKGGPDRRFSNNPLLPIFKYTEISMTTASGFRWDLQSSLTAQASNLARVVNTRSITLR